MLQPIPPPLPADENGYEAWLRYHLEENTQLRNEYRQALRHISGPAPAVAQRELSDALSAITGQQPAVSTEASAQEGVCYRFVADASLEAEGYRLMGSKTGVQIEATSEAGFLYGTFGFIRWLQLSQPLEALQQEEVPYFARRILNHWDDPKFDHTLGPFNVTRGFAGNSIFNWEDLTAPNPRIRDYGRLMSSIGFNATCINNVNADPDLLETSYLPQIKALADELRPYNLRLYLAVCFSAPMVTDGDIGEESYGLDYPFCMRNRKVRLNTLETADPTDPRVQDWWAQKAEEIYRLIPDFGGFVIKANSEGMPGPQDYGLTHADGANCIARALAPHGGTLFWRTFVYSGGLIDPKYEDRRRDGCTQPYLEFRHLDGQFDDNVILQTKNGPADFRAQEPPSSLFGHLHHTRQAIEVMAAQEYLGHTTHVCYQAEHWHRILTFDTHHQGEGSTIAALTAGRHGSYQPGAYVAIPNLGDDANWFGHLLAGANLYAAGIQGWNPFAQPESITADWARLTFGPDSETLATVSKILNDSYSVFSRYAAPLGMGYMHESCHHFEPLICRISQQDVNADGIGTDRTIATGSGYIGQYHPDAQQGFENLEQCPLEQVLFFHFLPWDYSMPDGRDLLTYLREDRQAAVQDVRGWLEAWRQLQGKVDPQRWAHVYDKLQRQYVHAGKWRDAGLTLINERSAVPAPQPANKQVSRNGSTPALASTANGHA